MIKQLDNKYLVLNWDNINDYLNNSEKRSLNMMIEKVAAQRIRDMKESHKAYVVVSETMECFDSVTNEVLNEINGIKPLVDIELNMPEVPKESEEVKEAVRVAKAVIKAAPKKKTVKKKFKSAGVVSNVKDKS